MRKVRPIYRFSAAVVVACAAATCPAAPTITGVSGTATTGADITITGSGFGAKAAAAPKLWDTVDNQPSYLSDVGGSLPLLAGRSVPVGAGYPWGTNSFSYPGAVVFSAANARHAQQTMHYRTSSTRGYLQWPNALGGEAAPASQTELYISFWVRPGGSVDTDGHSSKFIRVWDDPGGGGTRISWTQMHLTAANSAGYDATSWSAWGGDTGRWNRIELFVSAPRRLVQGWRNGVLVHNVGNLQKDPAFATRGLNLARVGWDPGGNTPPNVDLDFGDLYVDDTQARVELCGQPTWARCTAREVQPAASWSDNRIVFKLQPGALPGTGLYVYVVDASGAANANGVPIGTGAAKTPKAPAGLTAR